MIVRPQTRPQSILQATVKRWQRRPARGQRRLVHNVPSLGPQAHAFSRLGIPGFMTARAYEMVWSLYQQHLCDKLNEYTEGTTDNSLMTKELSARYARSPQHAALFNYASMAHNNWFFFKSLFDKPTQPSTSFLKEINNSFDGLGNLRTEMLESGRAMFGNGFVWLMKEKASGNLRILCTYNAGSPYPEAHYRQQSRDMANHSQPPPAIPGRSSLAAQLTQHQNTAGTFGNLSHNSVPYSPNSLQAMPILCVNIWQHVWLPDYGLFNKHTYLACWWERINWAAVEEAAQHVGAYSYKRSGFGSVLNQSLNKSRI